MFSIVVPIYNVEKYLEECLQSILNQSKDVSYEVLLIDDGSNDTSSDIAKEFENKYPTLFKYYRKDNGGLSDARNFAIPYATKEYIFYVDSDDFLAEGALLKLKNIVREKHPDLIVFNYIKKWNDCEKKVGEKELKEGIITAKDYLLMDPAAWNKVIKTSIVKERNILFPKGLWYEDRATTGSYLNYCDSIYYSQDYLYYYRQRDNSIMKQKSFNPKMMDILEVMELFDHQISDDLFYQEKEYINISNLMFQNSLRLLPLNRKKEMSKSIVMLNRNYPNWKQNRYFHKQSLGYKLLCILTNYKMYSLSKFIINVRLKRK